MINRTMNIIVTDYNKNWPQMFEVKATVIRDILKDELVEIHHIGSTAVPNLKAKSIIDIMLIVKDIEKVDNFNPVMIGIGYEPLVEFGIKGRRYLQKGGENRTHQIYIFQYDNQSEIERHLVVRDYLKLHHEDAIKYGKLKERLAQKFPKDIAGYCDGKNGFVQNLEQRAIEWKQENN
ncbi:hypothetical conserved protein [Candidatus Nitrosoglobus terrae]|uniref:Hypothetical conserved protein n=1 Tax=Candidatus Nitrosoglobus terrae TaxID=1630141 RepID=A0A1Q2SJS9_9GAMM|nr:GrpB family protein [Candidatus Nitrosoglobus terrae]BAW79385.1 hypothetical conserved protein [Candidatus Nitrosoglobus terrae]